MAASTTPINTIYTFLMYKATSAATTYTKLVDVKTTPQMGGEPEQVDITTLSDRIRKYIGGVEDPNGEGGGWTANYTAGDYARLKALEGQQVECALWIGGTLSGNTVTPTGDNGKWSWTGEIRVFKNGGEVNAAHEMTINTYPSTEVAFTYSA